MDRSYYGRRCRGGGGNPVSAKGAFPARPARSTPTGPTWAEEHNHHRAGNPGHTPSWNARHASEAAAPPAPAQSNTGQNIGDFSQHLPPAPATLQACPRGRGGTRPRPIPGAGPRSPAVFVQTPTPRQGDDSLAYTRSHRAVAAAPCNTDPTGHLSYPPLGPDGKRRAGLRTLRGQRSGSPAAAGRALARTSKPPAVGAPQARGTTPASSLDPQRGT